MKMNKSYVINEHLDFWRICEDVESELGDLLYHIDKFPCNDTPWNAHAYFMIYSAYDASFYHVKRKKPLLDNNIRRLNVTGSSFMPSLAQLSRSIASNSEELKTILDYLSTLNAKKELLVSYWNPESLNSDFDKLKTLLSYKNENDIFSFLLSDWNDERIEYAVPEILLTLLPQPLVDVESRANDIILNERNPWDYPDWSDFTWPIDYAKNINDPLRNIRYYIDTLLFLSPFYKKSPDKLNNLLNQNQYKLNGENIFETITFPISYGGVPEGLIFVLRKNTFEDNEIQKRFNSLVEATVARTAYRILSHKIHIFVDSYNRSATKGAHPADSALDNLHWVLPFTTAFLMEGTNIRAFRSLQKTECKELNPWYTLRNRKIDIRHIDDSLIKVMVKKNPPFKPMPLNLGKIQIFENTPEELPNQTIVKFPLDDLGIDGFSINCVFPFKFENAIDRQFVQLCQDVVRGVALSRQTIIHSIIDTRINLLNFIGHEVGNWAALFTDVADQGDPKNIEGLSLEIKSIIGNLKDFVDGIATYCTINEFKKIINNYFLLRRESIRYRSKYKTIPRYEIDRRILWIAIELLRNAIKHEKEKPINIILSLSFNYKFNNVILSCSSSVLYLHKTFEKDWLDDKLNYNFSHVAKRSLSENGVYLMKKFALDLGGEIKWRISKRYDEDRCRITATYKGPGLKYLEAKK